MSLMSLTSLPSLGVESADQPRKEVLSISLLRKVLGVVAIGAAIVAVFGGRVFGASTVIVIGVGLAAVGIALVIE